MDKSNTFTCNDGNKSKNKLNSAAKSLLHNVIRHTDSHNRHMEEAEMWQLHLKMKGKINLGLLCKNHERKKDTQEFKDVKIENSFLFDDRQDDLGWKKRKSKKAHMDDSEDRNVGEASNSTYWMRQLYKFEENDPDRWGHSGYKELYPGDCESDGDQKKKKKKQKKKKKEKDKDFNSPVCKKKKKKKATKTISRKEDKKLKKERKRKRSDSLSSFEADMRKLEEKNSITKKRKYSQEDIAGDEHLAYEPHHRKMLRRKTSF
ncbi:uncharacterized protein NKAPD1-like [Physella acuta]|uniref:uncharacterized protein NKAPD1-like n=1 Tax=Physella acuta TaxID=109671 RepID=UPI0027DD7FA2|nr:uncharacterized protein NKAPD1-like [Physella acuta]XP_059158101.1 uncharacterized protein NKAPD1-like [Physella acuta]XP_059158103.1 uncharacterized protein NKAPD1-like [Physella acuta]XP_059158104.1 uncharacterized protein NKAPD1-like [Physella acuta]